MRTLRKLGQKPPEINPRSASLKHDCRRPKIMDQKSILLQVICWIIWVVQNRTETCLKRFWLASEISMQDESKVVPLEDWGSGQLAKIIEALYHSHLWSIP